MSLWAGLNGLGAPSRSARVIDRDFEALASCDSLGTLSRHHGAHLTTKFGRYLAVDKRLLNRCGKLALRVRCYRRSVATDAVDMVRLDSLDAFAQPLRSRSIMPRLQPRPFL